MTKAEKLSRLLELVANTTIAHEAVLNSASGSQDKLAAIAERRKRLREIEDFATTAADAEVSGQALEAHGALVAVFNDAAIASILGAAHVLDGFATAFNDAADAANRRQVLTDRWATIAERTAGSAVALAQNVRDSVSTVKARIDAIRKALDDEDDDGSESA